MALRNALLEQVKRHDLEALFQTADSGRLWEEMKSNADILFSPFKHLLHSPPGWIEDNWKRAGEYNFLLDVSDDLKPRTVLDMNQVTTGVVLAKPPKDPKPFLYFFTSQYGHWHTNRDGKGIRSVIGCNSSIGSCPVDELPAYWQKIDDAIHETADLIESDQPDTESISAKFEAGAFYRSMTKSGDGPWDSYKDLSVLFHLVLPQFFPVHYLQTKDGYSQERGMLRLLDTLAALTGQPRKAVLLREYIGYSAVYRVLLALYDHWVNNEKNKEHKNPHFDYFTQFLADLTSRSNPESLLLYKKALIFYGIPGTSKTHNALELAKRLAAEDHVRLIQFHPNYSYQDFIIGIRPQINESGNVSYTVEPGSLYRAAAEAAQAWAEKKSSEDLKDRNEKGDKKEAAATEEALSEEEKEKQYRFVLVIDEINRADLAKVLGEVMYCIEYRQEHPGWRPLPLPHTLSPKTKILSLFQRGKEIPDPFKGGEEFYLPPNLYIIGAMNDADRSISGFDKALRRRFGWSRMDFCPVTLRQMIETTFNNAGTPVPENLPEFILRVQELNKRIRNGNASEDENNYELRLPLKGMEIGHTYFAETGGVMKMTPTRNGSITTLHLDHLWVHFLEPLLEEMIGGEVDQFRVPIDELKAFFIRNL